MLDYMLPTAGWLSARAACRRRSCPIMVFFYIVFEHSVVNMFLFPAGLMMGAGFSVSDYFWWNEIPTVLGNLVGGLTFTGLTLYSTHVRTAPKRVIKLAA